MCGIFAIRSHYPITKDLIAELFEMNKERGDKGIGLLFSTDKSYKVYRSENCELPDLDGYLSNKTRLVMGHTLASTGKTRFLHPLQLNEFYLAHNGIVEPRKDWGYIQGLDTATIIGGIVDMYGKGNAGNNELSVGNAIAATMSEIKGQAGCWLFDRETHKAYIWRQNVSLWYGMVDGRMIYSSAKLHDRPDMLFMPDGIVYEITKASPAPAAIYQVNGIY